MVRAGAKATASVNVKLGLGLELGLGLGLGMLYIVRIIVLIVILASSIGSASLIWSLVDVGVGLTATINVMALCYLAKEVKNRI